jgi:DNA modification methylase
MNQTHLNTSKKIEYPISHDFYFGDKPNPNLKAFVEKHVAEHPFDPITDNYDVNAFDKPIQTTKATAIYNMHTYWSKKPHDAIIQYIKHYTQPGDLILDPMCGSGSTALAALMTGRKAVAIDISPAATFITKNYCTSVDIRELEEAFHELETNVKSEISWLYETKCSRCGKKGTIVYTIYSQVFQCTRCLEKIPLYNCNQKINTKDGKNKSVYMCPICLKRGITEEIRTTQTRLGYIPVAFGYECTSNNICKPKRGQRDVDVFNKNLSEVSIDIDKLHEIDSLDIPYKIPENYMMNIDKNIPWGILWRPYLKDILKAKDFFTKRNLWAILAIKNAIKKLNYSVDIKEFLLVGVTAILYKSSIMMGYREDGIGRVMTGTYWLPPISKDINVWLYYLEWFNDVKRHVIEKNKYLNKDDVKNIIISTDDSTHLKNISNNSIDYIFTDPPYSWKVQYGESNFLWEVFLDFDTSWLNKEIIVNSVRNKTERDWSRSMNLLMKECYRVLKPGRWLSLCYHDTSEGTWSLIQDILSNAGFIMDKSKEALFIDSSQKSIKQITADKVTKRDLVINFRKPRLGEVSSSLILTGEEDFTTFNEKAGSIIREYLIKNPGSTKDHIYDELISRMVRRGQMQAHNFEDVLAQIAEPIKTQNGSGSIERWFLKGTELEIVDVAESEKEETAGKNLRKFIENYLNKHPESGGVHYSDMFEYYVYNITDKPRRELVDWLLDYFYITSEGTYRLPQTADEERVKTEGRSRGLNRKIRRYTAYIMRGVMVPDSDRPDNVSLVGWILHCRRSGLFVEGKLLYERGGLVLDGLSETEQVELDEAYQVCVKAVQG